MQPKTEAGVGKKHMTSLTVMDCSRWLLGASDASCPEVEAVRRRTLPH
jgi:hypothetical protein